MDNLVLATWEETGDFDCYAVSYSMTPQGMADYIAGLMRKRWQCDKYGDYPDHLTVFRSGDNYPEFVARYYLNKDYQTD